MVRGKMLSHYVCVCDYIGQVYFVMNNNNLVPLPRKNFMYDNCYLCQSESIVQDFLLDLKQDTVPTFPPFYHAI